MARVYHAPRSFKSAVADLRQNGNLTVINIHILQKIPRIQEAGNVHAMVVLRTATTTTRL
jgi:hypothetical protein